MLDKSRTMRLPEWLNGALSALTSIGAGVPQGSMLILINYIIIDTTSFYTLICC